MFFIAGIFFEFIAFIMLIRLLLVMGRPKIETPVKEFFMGKMKSDVFKMYPDQKHARISFEVNGKTYDTEVAIPKKMKINQGENIRITYYAKDPRIVRIYSPKFEIIPIIIMIVFGAALCILNQVLLNLIN